MAQALREVPAELEQALGQVGETVQVRPNGRAVDVTVTPFRLRQFSQVLKCVQRLKAGGVIESKTLTKLRDAASVEEATRDFDMVKMFLDGGDEIINILQIATAPQLKAHEVDKLDLLEGARLLSIVFAVNLDFFYQNRGAIEAALAPAVKAFESVVKEGVGVLGQPPSTDSEAPDTP
jgi:hypothetical protein